MKGGCIKKKEIIGENNNRLLLSRRMRVFI